MFSFQEFFGQISQVKATRVIRSHNLTKQPVIIAITANVLQEDIQECLDTGMDGYVAKSVKIALRGFFYIERYLLA